MKEITLVYNRFSEEYSLDLGRDENQRRDLGKLAGEELLEVLKKEIDFGRNSVIYLDKEISASLVEDISRLFDDTKVRVERKKS